MKNSVKWNDILNKLHIADYEFAELAPGDPRWKALGRRVDSMPYRYFRNSVNVDIYEKGVTFAWNSYHGRAVEHKLAVCLFSDISTVAKGTSFNLLLGIITIVLFALGSYFRPVLLLPALFIGFISLEKTVGIQMHDLAAGPDGTVQAAKDVALIKFNLRGGAPLQFLDKYIDKKAKLKYNDKLLCRRL